MKKVPWTVGAARMQSAVHCLIALVMFWLGPFGLHEIPRSFLSHESAHQLGLFLGLLLILLMASLAWGLSNRRAWARRAAMVFHGLTAVTALSLSMACTYPYLASDGRECGITRFGMMALAVLGGGIAFAVFVLAGGLLWWLFRVRDPENADQE